MATLVLGGIGAGLGFLAGGPAGAQLGFNIGALVGGILFPHNNQQVGRLEDLRVTGSSYGQLIPSTYGAVRLGANVIWARPLVEHHSGGKGLGPEIFTYTCTFAVSVCRGPVAGVRRIWGDDILIYDSSTTPTSSFIRPPYLGGEDQLPDTVMQSFLGVDNTPAFRGQCYIVFENIPLQNWGNRIPTLSVELMPDPFVPNRVSDVLTDLALQCGMVEGVDFDFGAMYDDVPGMSTTQRTAAYSLGEQLLTVFAGDMAEIDGMLVTVRRGEPSVGHLTVADMGANSWQSNNDSPPPTLSTVRKSDLSLPFKYDVTYASSDAVYGMGLQSAIRHSRQDIQDSVTLTTTITLSDAFASMVAYRLLDIQWLERVTVTISVGMKWLVLSPGSPFDVDVNGQVVRHRVTSMDISSMGVIALTLVEDNSITEGSGQQIGGYMNQVPVSGQVTNVTETVAASTPSTLFDVYSGPEFSDADGLSPGFYAAASRPSKVFYSTNGTDWVQGATIATAADFGLATSVLASAPPGIDSTDTVDVQLTNGDIQSAAAVDLPNGTNAALLGGEILSYQDVTPGASSGLSTLSTLTRGLRLSPTGSHAIGDRFWHLNTAIARTTVPVALIGTVVHVKVLTTGQSITDVDAQDVTIFTNTYPYSTPASTAAAIATALAGGAGIATYMTNGDPDGTAFLTNDGVLITSEG